MFKIFFRLVFLLLIVILSAVFIFIQFTLPNYEGKIYSDRIRDTITIYRDKFGMPIVKAENETDLAFGIGYAMAQDRLFQMDLIRRAVQGRLSEVLGSALIPTDKFFLTITSGKSLNEMWEAYPEDIKSLIKSFSDGVNHFIKENRLPIEFTLLGYKPELWTPTDSVAVFYYMSFDLNTGYDVEIVHYLIAKQFGLERAKELFPDYLPQKGEILEVTKNQNKKTTNETILTFLEWFYQTREFFGDHEIGASNNWVISPSKSETGTPILASDMHLAFRIPGIWYEAQLITPEYNVSGVLLPGIPFVIVGANENVAWAYTNVMADDIDFYIEQVNPNNPQQYLFRGQYRDFAIEKKIFKTTKDGQTQEEEFFIYKTHRGPIINFIYPIQTEEVFSMRWTAYDHFLSAIGIYIANKAKNIDDLEKATEFFRTPGQNWVYADKDGNIGFTAAVGIPIRIGFSGLLPMPGWNGQYEWIGYVPSNQLPRLRNPAKGWIATANNKHSSKYPYVISNYYHHADRYERIKQVLNSKEKFSIDDIKNLQIDSKALIAEELTPIFLKDLETLDLSQNPLAKQAIESLKNWNYETNKESIASSVFHVMLSKMVYNTFFPHLGEKLYKYYIKKQFIPITALRIFLKNETSFWFDHPQTPQTETRKDVIQKSFLEAIETLKAYSENIQEWKWGKVHMLEYQHPFGRNPLMAKIFNRGPYETQGSFSTVSMMDFPLEKFPYKVRSGVSERLILLPGRIHDSLRIIPSGVSGNPFNEFYADQIRYFLKNQYREFKLYKPEQKEFTYEQKLVIQPINQK
ncbi:MAG: penicillin acylase family protein [Leptospiraceae bacterium]|nr:penicillin acylase family protein [Leptospiraceae bacterium]MDW7976116.1 penicillin acylase family protein [Leptospiraceae bacterium]